MVTALMRVHRGTNTLCVAGQNIPIYTHASPVSPRREAKASLRRLGFSTILPPVKAKLSAAAGRTDQSQRALSRAAVEMMTR